jgi:SHS2 domain-containing protein
MWFLVSICKKLIFRDREEFDTPFRLRFSLLIMSYRFVDHTADVMVEVEARDREGLFTDAARSLFAILTDLDGIEPRESRQLRIEAEGWEQLLVTWLTELLFLYETELWLFSRFEILELGPNRLEAVSWGERMDAERHPIEREVKAVTYHRLGLVQEGGVYKTSIVFDL